jgi:hypothetical protein
MVSPVLADYEYSERMQIPAGAGDRLYVDCNDGSLEIVGRKGINEIKVKLEIFFNGLNSAEAKAFVDENVDFSLERNGDEVVFKSDVEAKRSKLRASGLHSNDIMVYIYMIVPHEIDVEIDGYYKEIMLRRLDGEIDVVGDYKNIIGRDSKGLFDKAGNYRNLKYFLSDDFNYDFDYDYDFDFDYDFDYDFDFDFDFDFDDEFDFYFDQGNVIRIPNIPKLHEFYTVPDLPELPELYIYPEHIELPDLPELPELPEMPELDEIYIEDGDYIRPKKWE